MLNSESEVFSLLRSAEIWKFQSRKVIHGVESYKWSHFAQSKSSSVRPL